MKYQGLIGAGIMVEDLESALTFYGDVLGLPLPNQEDDWVQLDAGNGSMREHFSGGEASGQAKTPAQQPSVIGMRVDDLDKAVLDLKQTPVHFIGGIGEL